MSNPIEAPRPEAPPYTWPNQDLKNLVQLAPMSPYTRALLRIKFNRPVPDACTTFEQIEAWLATFPKAIQPKPTSQAEDPPWRRREAEIARDEYIAVEATMSGSETRYVPWSKSGSIDVPLSVWERGLRAVEEYVESELNDFDSDYDEYNINYGDSDTDDFTIEDDLDDLMEEAEAAIRARDGVEDED